MSAYIIETHAIDRFISHLAYDRDHGTPRRLYWGRPFEKLPNPYLIARDGDPDRIPELKRDFERLAFDCHRLNVMAVDQRYGEKNQCEYTPRIDPNWTTSGPVQAYKSLQCFLDQCSEGDVPETPLFQAVSDYHNALARAIVDALPEYDKANWGGGAALTDQPILLSSLFRNA